MSTAQEKGKRARTYDAEAEGGEPTDAALHLSIKRLQEIQDEIEKVNKEANSKVLEVEQKYNEIRRPVYARRNEIIQKIPDFWLTTFLSHPTLSELLTEDDQQIFKHLESIDVVESEAVCSITFTFSPNPYFEDKRLTKRYLMSDDGTISVKATSIKWKAGMDIVNGKTCMRNGERRLLVDESFFTWFSDKKKSRLDHGDMDEVADIIMEELWPSPLKFFSNESEDEFEQEDEDEDEGSDEEEAEDGAEEDSDN